MSDPKVYIELENNIAMADFCNGQGCFSMNCVCAADGQLREATKQEAEGFWEDMSRWADERLAESQNDW